MCQLVSFKGNSPGIQHSGSSWASLQSHHPAPHVPLGLQTGLHPPNLPQISKCTRYPLIKLPNRLAAAFDVEEGLPARSSRPISSGSSAIKEQKGQAGGGVCFKSGCAHSHVHVCTCHGSVQRGTEVTSLSWPSYLCPLCYCIHL